MTKKKSENPFMGGGRNSKPRRGTKQKSVINHAAPIATRVTALAVLQEYKQRPVVITTKDMPKEESIFVQDIRKVGFTYYVDVSHDRSIAVISVTSIRAKDSSDYLFKK